MSTDPFVRARDSGDDFEGTRSSPSIALPGGRHLRARIVFVSTILLMLFSLACAPSRPIPPGRVQASDATKTVEFDAGQRARLDRLYAALEKPVPIDFSRGVLVRLAFDEAADLDLFVTDPMQESVYFANSPTRSGGTLIQDRRCGDLSPRVEIVHYPRATAGRYRVGVDFHRRCEESSLSDEEEKQGLYVVRVDLTDRIIEREGMVTPGRFEVIVIEFDVGR